MNTKTKVIVDNQSWLLVSGGSKIGSLQKEKGKYSLFYKGIKTVIGGAVSVKTTLGVDSLEQWPTSIPTNVGNTVYDYPTSSMPYNPLYNIQKKLPIYTKSQKSKSLFCAGYYVININEEWTTCFCPKLITLRRCNYQGPFKTSQDMENALNLLTQNETIKHSTY